MMYRMTDGTPIGVRIARRRQVLNMTQEELAARVGVARVTVSNWESGKHPPKRKLGAIEQALGISLDDPPPEPDPERIRAAFLNAGYPPERADYFTSVVIGVRNGTLTITRSQPGEDQESRQAAG